MNLKRFNELLDISNVTFLTFDEQEEFITLSTEMMYHMLETDKIVDDILNKNLNHL
jgi:hypothetical protein